MLALLLGLAGTAQAASRVYVIPLDMPIHPLAAEVIERGLEQAVERQADLVVLEINTPGGLMSSMERIISALVAHPVPVVGFVYPGGGSADSAGFFILMACDLAAMAPGTNTGAAHPVPLFGEQEQGESIMAKKIETAAAARIRSLVERRGRNLELAEKAVVEPRSFTADEALREGLVELVVDDYDALLEAADGRTVVRIDGSEQRLELDEPQLERYTLTGRQRFLEKVAQPQIAYLLLLLGAVGLYIEFTHPGTILPGVAGALALLVALYGMSFLPVNWVGLLLLVLGGVLLALEVKITSYGALATGGIVALVLGSLMLFEGPIPELRVGLPVILPTVAVTALIVMALLSAVLRSYKSPPLGGSEGLVGRQGEAMGDLEPKGKVFIHGEIWNATARVPVRRGQRVRVLAVRGLSLEVEPAEE